MNKLYYGDCSTVMQREMHANSADFQLFKGKQVQTSYRYRNQSLTPKNAQPLIVELFGNSGNAHVKSERDNL